MAYLLMLMFSNNFITKLEKKILVKSVYLDEILVKALFHYDVASWATSCKTFIASKVSIVILAKISSATIYIIKVLELSSNTVLINLCLSINLTYLAIRIAFALVYVLQINSLIPKCIFALLEEKNNISRITFILVLASKKVSSKNQIMPSLL